MTTNEQSKMDYTLIPTVSVSDDFSSMYHEYTYYIVKHPDWIKAKWKKIPIFKIVLVDDSEIYFMTNYTFMTWYRGKTYKFLKTGVVYHSGIIIGKERE